MGVAVTGVGHFQIPTAPAAGTSVVSGAANALTGTAIVLSASTSAMLITGVHVEQAAASAATYTLVQLCQGAGGAETSIGQYLVPLITGSTVALGFHNIYPPIKVAASVRLTVKTADSVGSKTSLITVEGVLSSNVVDDGTAVTTVTTVTNQLTAAQIATGVWQDATSGDFTTASSIGKTLYIANVAPGASGGLMISGTNAGTTTLGALTITGATTHTGNVVLSDGLTISAPSTGNRSGLDITGNGTGAAIKATGGATGIGFSIIGGGTSGDGIKVTTTSGHGINLAPVGTSMHGFLSTGGNGGTSDGIKAAAGTGGVDIRGNITGNLVGTVSTLTTYTGNTLQTGDSFARIGALGAGLTGITNVALASGQKVDVDTIKTNPVVNAGTITFPTTATLASTTNLTAGTIATVTNQLTAAAIATGVWTDTTAGDFTAALSVGKSVMNGVALGTGLTINSYTGNTVQTGDSFARLGAAGAGLTALGDTRIANLDGTVTSRMASYTQPTGFLAATFPTGTIANTTNVTAGTMTTTTNLTTNNDKTGYSLTAGERSSIADAWLDRDLSAGSDSGSTTVRTPRQALRFLRNKWAIAAGTLTVYKEDDSTSSWTATVSTDAAALPIISNDPAGP